MNSSFRFGAAALIVAALAAGACGPKKVETKPPAPAPPTETKPAPTTPPSPPAPAPPAAPTPERSLTEEEIFMKMTLEELNKKGHLTDVFFAFDSIELGEKGRASIQKNAEVLKKWASTKVIVEGHADSRGTSEYNLALGERRADAVRDYIVGLGVPAGRVTIVSKGKEQPFCREETEACWEQNRRGHFLFTAK
jgi:peptidoglycan-associated lipoprotein